MSTCELDDEKHPCAIIKFFCQSSVHCEEQCSTLPKDMTKALWPILMPNLANCKLNVIELVCHSCGHVSLILRSGGKLR